MARVAAEPFARAADDVAMNAHLRTVELADDPMLAYMRSKKVKKQMMHGLGKFFHLFMHFASVIYCQFIRNTTVQRRHQIDSALHLDIDGTASIDRMDSKRNCLQHRIIVGQTRTVPIRGRLACLNKVLLYISFAIKLIQTIGDSLVIYQQFSSGFCLFFKSNYGSVDPICYYAIFVGTTI
jgi:hypothetical protein